MNLKRLLTLLLALTLVISLASCEEKCDGHVDADDDYLCDKCGEDYDDGDEYDDSSNKQHITFIVKLDNGEPLSGIGFTVSRGELSYSLVSDANGNAELDLEVGPYAVSYDYDSIPMYCSPEISGFRVDQGTETVVITIVDNNPDGSIEKPFFISENETEITLAPGQELYFNYRGSSQKYASVNNDAAVIMYNGESYAATDGQVTVLITPEKVGQHTTFSVKNDSDSEFTATLTLVAPIGSSENPFELTENTASLELVVGEAVYYQWTAEKDGVLILNSSTEHNNISISKILENDVSIISQTGGTGYAYLAVCVGDKVIIAASVTEIAEEDEENKNNVPESSEMVSLEFALNVYAGTETEPVPVLKNDISISLEPGASVVFGSEAGMTVSIDDESIVGITHNGTSYTNEDGGEISVELTDPTFILENKDDHLNGITVRFK